MGNVVRWSNDLILRLIHEYEARPCLWDIRDLQIGLRVRDRWVRVRFSNFKPVTFPEPLFFKLVLGKEISSWDEMGMCCDNVKPETRIEKSYSYSMVLNLVLVVQSEGPYFFGMITTTFSRDFARKTAGELWSTITNLFRRLTMWMIVGDSWW